MIEQDQLRREADSYNPSVWEHALAKWDGFRQSFSGSGPIQSITSERGNNGGISWNWSIILEIYPRGGERVKLLLPHGGYDSVNANDIIH